MMKKKRAKKSSKKLSVVKKGKNLIKHESFAKRISAAVKAEAERVGGEGGNRISTRNGELAIGGVKIPYPFQCVVLDFARWKNYFEVDFDPDNPAPAGCFSVISTNAAAAVKDMIPSPNSPAIQAKTCGECERNVFGAGGQAKECRDSILVRLIDADDLDNMESAEPLLLSIPPTSMASFNSFHRKCIKVHETPLYGVVCTITKGEHKSGGWTLEFTAEDVISLDDYEEGNLDLLISLVDDSADTCLEEPDVSNYDEMIRKQRKPRKRGRKKVSKKKRGGRR